MITNKELNEVSLSPTKKDYYQIWNELIELATKISERWSPDSTNESDPGIVLLKTLVAVADKLNYNIDKNTLEAFMPSATQVESMRKLTEMMGYSMKYYRAATCDVTISYKDSNESTLSDFSNYGIYFPKFVNLKNEEEDVNYVTLEEFTLQSSEPTRKISAIEGELIECETNNDNIISMLNLDDNNRYMLPEVNVAENAVFVFNIDDSKGSSVESDPWEQVDNLNTQLPSTKCFKFGYDSLEGLPYIQFPDDISNLIKDGIRIKYIRTNGVNGNISARTLCKLEPPALWSTADDEQIQNLTADNFTVTNVTAASNGANPESLNEAYNSYKKVIGTFDTLVTCRDYMNRIYQLTTSETDTTPLVSNAIVSDIRDDINNSTILCSFNDYGISYTDVALKSGSKDLIEHFDLMLYPFKTVYGLNTKDEYQNSFTYNAENVSQIRYDLEKDKTIAHNIKLPENDKDIICIKNYMQLKARITTVKKVTSVEEKNILANIKTAIYKNFNCRKIDFGEEIPYDTILEVIENADSRIKDVNLDDPVLYTKLLAKDGGEYELVSADNTGGELSTADTLYNKLVLRNVLAGRIAAFNYDEDFKVGYDETTYKSGTDPYATDPAVTVEFSDRYPNSSNKYLAKMTSEFRVLKDKVPADKGLVLKENEVIQFRLPNFRTAVTYPCYVNYFVKLNITKSKRDAIPATFISLGEYMGQVVDTEPNGSYTDPVTGDTVMVLRDIELWEVYIANNAAAKAEVRAQPAIIDAKTFDNYKINIGAVFTLRASDSRYIIAEKYETGKTYYTYEITSGVPFVQMNTYIQETVGKDGKNLLGLFRMIDANTERPIGKYVDANHIKYLRATQPLQTKTPALSYNVQETFESDTEDHTANGLGLGAEYPTITADSEYQLHGDEYLLINYTDSDSNGDGTETKTTINKYYGEGTIIKPNFALMDSDLYHNTHSYTKKEGFYFAEAADCEGLFTLGTNEQICIREMVSVDLDKAGTYLFWERENDDPEELYNYFEFDEPYGGTPNMAYTLKEGEHLYYTDSKKTDIAYYGAGTLIVKHSATPLLRKKTTDGTVSEEDIMTYGLAAAIPWGTAYNLEGDDKKLTIIENQYISLTEGDTLRYISTSDDDPDEFEMDLDNNWVDVEGAVYKFGEDQEGVWTTLPVVNITLPNDEKLKWKVRSRLDFNMSATTPQTLNAGDSISIYMSEIGGTNLLPPIKLCPLKQAGKSDITPLTIFSNYTCQYASDKIDLKALGLESNFKLKLAATEKPIVQDSSTQTSYLNLNNYINGDSYFTKFSLDTLEQKSKRSIFTLNININDVKIEDNKDEFGLIMFYYIDENYGKTKHHPAKITTDGVNGVREFNTSSTTLKSSIELKPGIQVIEVRKNVKSLSLWTDYTGDDTSATTATITDESTTCKSIVIFSELSLVKGINKKLDYRFDPSAYTSTSDYPKSLRAILKDIKNTNIADKFYYNNPIDKTNTIELNPNLDDELLSSPLTWYDPNNTNNKFVISEIDADYLSAGITLTKASKV